MALIEEKLERENHHVCCDVVNTRADDLNRRCTADEFHDVAITAACRNNVGDVGKQLRDIRDAENF